MRSFVKVLPRLLLHIATAAAAAAYTLGNLGNQQVDCADLKVHLLLSCCILFFFFYTNTHTPHIARKREREQRTACLYGAMSSVRRGEKRGTAKLTPPVASRADGVQCSLGQPCCTATSSIIEKSWQRGGTTWDCLSSQEPQELLRARAVWLG